MAYSFPEGAQFQFSSTFAAAVPISAITNADPAVATATNTFVDADEILLESGWENATDSIYRVASPSGTTFSVDSLDTTSTVLFPVGAGSGSAQKVSSWSTIPQVLTIATSGGDPRMTTISPLSRRRGISVPTGINPQTITLTLGYDASNAVYKEMLAASRTLTKVAFKMLLADASASYGYGYIYVGEVPQLQTNQANQVTAVFTLLGNSINYAGA